ncbi:MAG: DUF2061 domain-containing protein [Pirellulaceae bacterium]|nr:DUF2061 domain-containing protein [Pirellulaceae bacterium]
MSNSVDGFEETRTRSLTKTVSWRCCAVLNSFTILVVTPTSRPIVNAIAMNVTGFCVFYFFERIWNQVAWGRLPKKQDL